MRDEAAETAPGARPGCTPAWLGASLGLIVSICEMGTGGLKLHSCLLLCWSGGEEAGRDRKSGGRVGLACGTCLDTHGPSSSPGPHHTLDPCHVAGCHLLPGMPLSN